MLNSCNVTELTLQVEIAIMVCNTSREFGEWEWKFVVSLLIQVSQVLYLFCFFFLEVICLAVRSSTWSLFCFCLFWMPCLRGNGHEFSNVSSLCHGVGASHLLYNLALFLMVATYSVNASQFAWLWEVAVTRDINIYLIFSVKKKKKSSDFILPGKYFSKVIDKIHI